MLSIQDGYTFLPSTMRPEKKQSEKLNDWKRRHYDKDFMGNSRYERL